MIHIGRKRENLDKHTPHVYTLADRWSILAGQTHTTGTHIARNMEHLGRTNTYHMYTHWPKDGASRPDKHICTTCTHIGRKMEHLGRTNTHHIYTHSVKRWVHLDRLQAERWSVLGRQTHTTCTHILSKDGCILTESRPKDGASWADKHTPHVHTFCQKMGAS